MPCPVSILAVPYVLSATLLASAPAKQEAPLHERIDALIAAGHKDYAKQAAPLADDAEFLRRVCLDFRGSIPTADELREFLADKSQDKREKKIDALLAAPSYGRRMADYFDATFMERRKDTRVTRGDWEKYLRAAFARNRGYNALVREILSADGADPDNRAPAKFMLDRDADPNLITKDIGRLFLGRNLQCAQCHDHPSVEGYKQDHYYGIYAFVGRSYLFPRPTDPTAVIADKADGEATFMSVFDKTKSQKVTTPHMPGAKPIEEPKVEKGKEFLVPSKGMKVRPVPAYSRRARLAETLTNDRAFSRTSANRFWAFLFGRGIIDPLDMDHEDNLPSHPELLNLLTDEFAAHNFNVKWLLREFALSKTYQRSSVVPNGLSDVPADRYLVGGLKPLTPEQLAYSVAVATDQVNLDAKGGESKMGDKVSQFRTVFAAAPGEPEEGNAPTLGQSLFLKFGTLLRDLTATKSGNLTEKLAKEEDNAKLASELFMSVLSRPPMDEEVAEVAAGLKGANDRPAAVAELVWALITSGEFRFNH